MDKIMVQSRYCLYDFRAQLQGTGSRSEVLYE